MMVLQVLEGLWHPFIHFMVLAVGLVGGAGGPVLLHFLLWGGGGGGGNIVRP